MTKIGELKLYDIKELSSLLGLNRITVRKYINSGEIKAKKVGRKYLVTESALKEYFAA